MYMTTVVYIIYGYILIWKKYENIHRNDMQWHLQNDFPRKGERDFQYFKINISIEWLLMEWVPDFINLLIVMCVSLLKASL